MLPAVRMDFLGIQVIRFMQEVITYKDYYDRCVEYQVKNEATEGLVVQCNNYDFNDRFERLETFIFNVKSNTELVEKEIIKDFSPLLNIKEIRSELIKKIIHVK